MASNLAGEALAETFSTAGVGADAHGPYTNVGGADQAATLTLTTSATDVVVTEAAGAFSGAGEAIGLVIDGPGEFEFLGDDGYAGGTTIEGGTLDLATSGAAGAGTITFAADAYATLKLEAGVDLANAISLPDATDAIDLAGVPYVPGDHLVLTASGAVSTYALETAGGAVLETLHLTGALSDSSLLVAPDGNGGTEIAAPYTAAAAVAAETSIKSSATRIFISDTANDIGNNFSSIFSLLDDGLVAAMFVSNLDINLGDSGAMVALIGGDDSFGLSGDAQATGAIVSGTNGDWDQGQGNDGRVDLDGGQVSLNGGLETVDAIGGVGNAVSLYNTRTGADVVNGSDMTVYLTAATASVAGGGDAIVFSAGGDDLAELENTSGQWDGVRGPDAKLTLTNAQTTVTGGGAVVTLEGSTGNGVSFYDSDDAWDAVSGDDATIYLTSAQVTVSGDGDSVYLAGGTGNAILFSNAYTSASAAPAALFGSNTSVKIDDSMVSITGGGDTVIGGGMYAGYDNNATLVDTGGDWDTVSGQFVHVILDDAQASVFASETSNGLIPTIIFESPTGNAVSLYGGNAFDRPFLVEGWDGYVYLTNSSAYVVGSADTAMFSGGVDDSVAFDDSVEWNDVLGSSGKVSLNNASASVFGGDDTVDLGDDSAVSLYQTNGAADTIDSYLTGATVYMTSAQANMVGKDDTIYFAGGAGNLLTLATKGGWEVLYGSNGTINLKTGNVSVNGGGDTIVFAEGTFDAASLYATQGVADTVVGENGHIFLGGAQANVTGWDDLIGFSGDATLTLSGAYNTLAFAQGIGGKDNVTGFTAYDFLQFSKADFTNYAALSGHISTSGGNAVITLDASDSVTLVGVAASSLSASNFKFV